MKNYITFLLCAFYAVAGFSQNSYLSHEYGYDNLPYISETVTADLDGDGDQDFILCASDGKQLLVGINNNLAKPLFKKISEGINLYDVVAHDIDGDGDIDIIASAAFENKTYWWRNDGNNDFTQLILNPISYDAIHFADLDKDGTEEIITSKSDVLKSYNFKNGSLVPKQIISEALGWGPDGIDVIDVNGDDIPDIITCDVFKGILIFEQNPINTFIKNTALSTEHSQHKVIGSDVDGDGDIDILSYSTRDRTTAYYKNTGSLNFESVTLPYKAGEIQDLVYGDYDNDGDVDILLTEKKTGFSDDFIVLENNAGNFEKLIITDMYVTLSLSPPVDVDNDGDIDLVFYNNFFGGPQFVILENSEIISVDKESTPFSVTLFPTIFQSELHINTAGLFDYKVVNINGQIIDQGRALSSIKLNTTLWPIGNYLITVTANNRTRTEKVLKM